MRTNGNCTAAAASAYAKAPYMPFRASFSNVADSAIKTGIIMIAI